MLVAAGGHACKRSGGKGADIHAIQQHAGVVDGAADAGGLWLPHHLGQHASEEAQPGDFAFLLVVPYLLGILH